MKRRYLKNFILFIAMMLYSITVLYFIYQFIKYIVNLFIIRDYYTLCKCFLCMCVIIEIIAFIYKFVDARIQYKQFKKDYDQLTGLYKNLGIKYENEKSKFIEACRLGYQDNKIIEIDFNHTVASKNAYISFKEDSRAIGTRLTFLGLDLMESIFVTRKEKHKISSVIKEIIKDGER